jgi:hypothetical protein
MCKPRFVSKTLTYFERKVNQFALARTSYESRAAQGLPCTTQANKNTMTQRRLLILAISIPVLFVSLALLRRLLEYYFRFSIGYKYIYTVGSSVAFSLQLFLILCSLLYSIYIFLMWRRFNKWAKIISLLIGSSLFCYFTAIFTLYYL